jgi:hypothetical protein
MRGSSLRKTAEVVSQSRRAFLNAVTGATLSRALSKGTALRAASSQRGRKIVVVTFGGGARDDETFQLEGRANIPHLVGELIPQATFFTQVINRGILGHCVANASLATGAYEVFNNFAPLPPRNPTVFEYFRKDLRRPESDVWVIAPSNGFQRIGESSHRSYGEGLGAGVILPKRLLAAALRDTDASEFESLLHDNYEVPFYLPEEENRDIELHQLASVLKLSVSDFAAHARGLESADELSVFIARRLMQRLAPSLLWITLHDIDIAHAGAFSLYVDAIRRSDRLCAEIWNAIERDPEYAGKTTMFILPDFGRDSDDEASGNGFQHHRTGDARSRTSWALVLGRGIRENVFVDRAAESIDLAPTLGALLGFSTPFAQGRPMAELFL